MALSEALFSSCGGDSFHGQQGEAAAQGCCKWCKEFWSNNGVDEKQGCAQAEGVEDPQYLLPAPGTSLHHTRM